MKNYFPILDWLSKYSLNDFFGDLPAGITVGIMLIPQGMAYAMIAGLPPVYGLYASLVPQIIYAILGTSRKLAVGPVAMDSLMVATGLSSMASIGSESYIALTIVLAFIVGVFQFIFGLLKLGFLVNFLSKPVINGFTSAAAIIIGLNQVKHLFGINLKGGKYFHELLYELTINFGQLNKSTLFIGVVGIGIMIAIKKIAPKIPAPIVIVVGGIAVFKGFDLSEYGVKILGDIPRGLPSLALPKLSMDMIINLLSLSLTISMVAFMESISISKAIEQKNQSYKVHPNRELIALGAANIVGSFFQSYPTTGGFSRTAINDQMGAKTSISAIIAAVIVGGTLLFLTPLFYYLPNAVLASIIIVAVFGLIDFSYPKRLWKNRKEEFTLLLFTFLVTLFVGITQGISLGIGLSILLLVVRTTKPHLAVLGKIKEKNIYKNVKRFECVEELDDVLIVRFDSQLYFANANYFKENISGLIKEKGEQLKLLVLSAEGINFIDSSAANMLRHTFDKLQKKGIKIKITNAIGPVRDIFKKSEIRKLIGEENFHLDIGEALARYEDGKCGDHSHIVLQTNN